MRERKRERKRDRRNKERKVTEEIHTDAFIL